MGNYARVMDYYNIHLKVPKSLEGFENRLGELFPDLTVRPIGLQGYTHRVTLDGHKRNIRRLASLIGSLLSDSKYSE